MSWRIVSGPDEIAGGSFDGVRWRFRLEDAEEHAVNVTVGVSGTALAVASLPIETAEAIATRGRSAIERFLQWQEPPTGVTYFTTDRPAVEGGVPPAEESGAQEVLESQQWVSERGFTLELQQQGSVWQATVQPLGWVEEGASPAEAARLARERVEVDDIKLWFHERGYELILHQPGGVQSGWFAPFMRHDSTGGSAAYGWGQTRLEAAQDAQREFLQRNEESSVSA